MKSNKLGAVLIIMIVLWAISWFGNLSDDSSSDYDYSYSSSKTTSQRKCLIEGCERSPGSSYSYCRLHRCREDGCNTYKGQNGTIYCDDHAKIFLREQGERKCLATDCYRSQGEIGLYCYYHECAENDCLSAKVDDTDYCEEHQIKKKTVYMPIEEPSKEPQADEEEPEYPDDPYDVYEYSDPEDFYYDNSEDFDGYDDAETYYDDAWREVE